MSSRRGLKKKRYEAEGAKEYREVNRRIEKAVKKARGLDRCSVRGECNLPEQKQQQESISDGKGSNLRETGSVLNYPGQVREMSY